MNKLFKILMIIWVAVAAFGVIMGVYALFTGSYKDASYFIVIAVVATIMYFINKRRQKFYIDDPAKRSVEKK